ncbi:HU family DNA-binding protein [Pelagibius sp. CAU 1746]|uniref:HU family DNA-binding protein n=1 Tax=Pelagibius sp. CAU 1746 TaxID=3140370 RepID=UPI00325B193A
MAKKPAKKAAKKSAAKKPAAKKAVRVTATPAGSSDREKLVEVIKAGTGCTNAAARDTVTALLGTVSASLKKNNKVQLPGFGTFMVTKRAARKGINPRTGEAIKIKASKSVRFKPGQALKGSL